MKSGLLDRFAAEWWGPGYVALVCLAAGLVLRCWWRLRTHPGLAAVGLAATAAVYGKGTVAIFLLSGAAFLYVRLVGAVARPGRRSARWPLALGGVAALATVFLLQSAGLLPAGQFGGGWRVVLDMLLALRLVLFVWEFGAGRFDRPGVAEFLAWAGLPFATGNPVLRYTEFRRQQPWKVVPLPPVGRGWWVGLAANLGKFAAGAGLAAVTPDLWAVGWPGKLAVLYFAAPVGWYLRVAAAAGLFRLAGALGGVAVPVNWAAPFASRNLADFWGRWNITVTHAFRDMLFYNRWGLARPTPYLNTVLVFLAVGLWHGVSGYWVLWGLLHGLGFCTFLLWRQVRGPAARPLPAAVGWGLTYLFVCSCWAVPPQVLKYVSVGPSGSVTGLGPVG